MLVPLDTDATLDLAILGVTRQQAEPPAALCRHVHALVAPWLTPTAEVVLGRALRLRAQGLLEALPGSSGAEALGCTAAGAGALAGLAQRPLREPMDAAALAGEVVKLACLDLLDSATAMAVAADLVTARHRSHARLRQRLARHGARSPAVARGLEHQLRLLEAAEEAMRALLTGAGGVPCAAV